MNGCFVCCYIRWNDSSSVYANSGLALNGEFSSKRNIKVISSSHSHKSSLGICY